MCSVLLFIVAGGGRLHSFSALVTSMHVASSLTNCRNKFALFAALMLPRRACSPGVLVRDQGWHLGIKISMPARPADLAYSDDYSSNGQYNGTFPPQPEYALTRQTQGQTYQPHWCAALWRTSCPSTGVHGTVELLLIVW